MISRRRMLAAAAAFCSSAVSGAAFPGRKRRARRPRTSGATYCAGQCADRGAAGDRILSRRSPMCPTRSPRSKCCCGIFALASSMRSIRASGLPGRCRRSASGCRPIQRVSGYRSPQTNERWHERSGGVAAAQSAHARPRDRCAHERRRLHGIWRRVPRPCSGAASATTAPRISCIWTPARSAPGAASHATAASCRWGFVLWLAACQPSEPEPQAVPRQTAAPIAARRCTLQNCVPCHRDNGEGVPKVFPSLAGSPAVLGDPVELAQLGVEPEAAGRAFPRAAIRLRCYCSAG